MNIENYKLELYTPSKQYRGQLIASSLNVELRMGDISNISFQLPYTVEGFHNYRVDEVLDNYIVKLTFGESEKKSHFFRVDSLPQNIDSSGLFFNYSGSSLERDLDFEHLDGWEGVERRDYYKVINGKPTSTPEFIDIPLTNNNVDSMYVNMMEKRTYLGKTSETELVQVSDVADLKSGFFFIVKGETSSYIRYRTHTELVVENGVTVRKYTDDLEGVNLDLKIFDNPLNKSDYVGYLGETRGFGLTDIDYVPVDTESVIIDGVQYFVNKYLTKYGVEFKEVFEKLNTGWNLIEISNDGLDKISGKRSHFDFENISKLAALKKLFETFEVDHIFEVDENLTKKIIVFEKDARNSYYGNNRGFNITYGNYLRSMNKEINSTAVITAIKGEGASGMKTSSITPTGEWWEDYSYYLEDFAPENCEPSVTAITLEGINLNPKNPNPQSRWFDNSLAERIAKWQVAKTYIHEMLMGKKNTLVPFTDAGYFGAYNERKKTFEKIIKLQDEATRARFAAETEYGQRASITLKNFNNMVVGANAVTQEMKDAEFELYKKYKAQSEEAFKQYESKKQEYTELEDALTDVFDARMTLIRDYLKYSNWGFSEELLKPYRKMYFLKDTNIDQEEELLNSMIKYLDENKKAKITLSIDIVDFLANQNEKLDHDKINLGDRVYLLMPELNVDEEAQIREISIDFIANSLSLIIASGKNYNKNPLLKLTKAIRKIQDDSRNMFTGAAETARESEGVNNKFIEEEINGSKTSDTTINIGTPDANGEYSTILNGEGFVSHDSVINHQTGEITSNRMSKITINAGSLLAENDDHLVEVSGRSGFSIKKKIRQSGFFDGELQDLLTIREGDLYFSGKIEAINKNDSSAYLGIFANTTAISSNAAILVGGMTWDTAKFAIKYNGDLKATSGRIGGWNISDDIIYNGESNARAALGRYTNSSSKAFWSGSQLGDSAPFSVGFDGSFKATKGEISGFVFGGEYGNILTANVSNRFLKLDASLSSLVTSGGDDFIALEAGRSDNTNLRFRVMTNGNFSGRTAYINEISLAQTLKTSDNYMSLNNTALSFDKYLVLSKNDGVKINATSDGTGYSKMGLKFGFSASNGVAGNYTALYTGRTLESFNFTTNGSSTVGVYTDNMLTFSRVYDSITSNLVVAHSIIGSTREYSFKTSTAGITIETTGRSASKDININSGGDINLRTGWNGSNSKDYRIYVQSPGFDNGDSLSVLRAAVSWGGFDSISTKIAKKDIKNIESNKIIEFLEKVEVKEFKYKVNNQTSYSFIIEDEEEKETPLLKEIFDISEDMTLYENYDSIPEYFREYVDNPAIFKKTESGKYKMSMKGYSQIGLSGLMLASIKYLHEENKKLKQDIELIKSHLKID